MENPRGTHEQTSNEIEHLSEQRTTLVRFAGAGGDLSSRRSIASIFSVLSCLERTNDPTHDRRQSVSILTRTPRVYISSIFSG